MRCTVIASCDATSKGYVKARLRRGVSGKAAPIDPTDLPDGLSGGFPVQSLSKKYFSSPLTQITS
jgi:hypothetical protein